MKPNRIQMPSLYWNTPTDALKQFTNADWIPQTMTSKAVRDGNCVLLIQYPFMNRDLQVNYFTSNLPVSSFETDRKKFLGNKSTALGKTCVYKRRTSNTEAFRRQYRGCRLGTLQLARQTFDHPTGQEKTRRCKEGIVITATKSVDDALL
jgi:cellobiose phosphorylase